MPNAELVIQEGDAIWLFGAKESLMTLLKHMGADEVCREESE